MLNLPTAVVVALDGEIRVIKSRMAVDSQVHIRPSLFTLGQYEGKPLVLVRSGIGPRAMKDACRYLIDRYRPKFCLHVGYCGGTDPRYGPGDMIVAEAVVDGRDGRRYEAPADLVKKALGICRDTALRARKGAVVTVNVPVCAPHEKAFVGTQHDAQGIDMESAALADVCTSTNTAYLVARAVLDPLDSPLPAFDDVVDESGTPDAVALAGHMVKNPKDILKIPRLQYCAMQARQSITAFVDAWLKG